MMIDYLFQAGLSNSLFALALAIVATLVGSKLQRPRLAYLLWLAVFVKLVTPPIVNFPLPDLAMVESNLAVESETLPTALSTLATGADQSTSPAGELSQSRFEQWTAFWSVAKPWICSVWIVGSLCCAMITWYRIRAFHCLLEKNLFRAPARLDATARRIGKRLEMNNVPKLQISRANVSPMVWCTIFQTRIVLPEELLARPKADRELVLAHELAHVHRGDHRVRWLEWVAVTLFWWNPIVWWAQKRLRAMEEICCDAMVLKTMNPDPLVYANAILATVESLVVPAVRPPAMASGIGSGGLLEKRFEMIISGNIESKFTRHSKLMACSLMLLVIPFGFVQGQDFEKVEKRLAKSVEKGQLTERQADAMMETLRAMADNGHRAEAENDDHHIRRDQDLATIRQKIRDAVNAGKISRAQGVAKMAAIRKQIANHFELDQERRHEEELHQVEMKIHRLINEGEMTEEEGRARMDTFKQQHGQRLSEIGQIERDIYAIQLAVAHEELSKEVAHERIQALKQELDHAKLLEAKVKIKEAVAAGELSKHLADLRLAEMARHLKSAKNHDSDKARNLELLARGLKLAIEKGEIDEAEAKEKLKWFEKKLHAQERHQKYRAIELEIREAISAGKLTPEEGHEKIHAIREKLFGADNIWHEKHGADNEWNEKHGADNVWHEKHDGHDGHEWHEKDSEYDDLHEHADEHDGDDGDDGRDDKTH